MIFVYGLWLFAVTTWLGGVIVECWDDAPLIVGISLYALRLAGAVCMLISVSIYASGVLP